VRVRVRVRVRAHTCMYVHERAWVCSCMRTCVCRAHVLTCAYKRNYICYDNKQIVYYVTNMITQVPITCHYADGIHYPIALFINFGISPFR